MDIMLFGTGDCYSKYKKWFEGFHIVALLDNDRNKQGTRIDGHRVLAPAEGVRECFDYIFILSVHEAEIRRELQGLGVDDSKIRHYYGLYPFLTEMSEMRKLPVHFYPHGYGQEYLPDGKRTVLMLSYDLNPSGAFFAFFETAATLKVGGYHVVFAAMNDGPMKKEVLDLGIPLIVDPNMQISTCSDIDWIAPYDLVFCNTVNFYHMLSERDETKAYIWWLHEPEIFYGGIDEEEIRKLSCKNLYICAAGKAAVDAFRRLRPDTEVSLLLYGIPDAGMGRERHICENRSGKKFAVVGNVQNYKGQDVLIAATRLLDEAMRMHLDIYIFGNVVSKYAQDLMREAGDLPFVHFEGEIAHEELLDKLSDMDVLICPSREDTMPVAVTEAMMFGIPCIVSDAVGTAEYILDGVEGMVFKNNDASALAKAVCRCISGEVDLAAMGSAARQLYDNKFSMRVFEKNLLEIIGRRMETIGER